MNEQLDIENVYQQYFTQYPDVLNVKQLSKILGVCEKTVLRLLIEQEIQSIKIGRIYRVPKLYLLQYLGMIDSKEISPLGK
jgi:DNA binding domain, excisionase family